MNILNGLNNNSNTTDTNTEIRLVPYFLQNHLINNLDESLTLLEKDISLLPKPAKIDNVKEYGATLYFECRKFEQMY